jgi:NAD(P)-dependent dehydrogenase (short-subunit alcohol dehydrogenase family)
MTDEFNSDTLGAEMAEKINIRHPSGFGEVNDVAAAAVYLLSDASRYVVGATLTVDGGYCAQ